MLPKDLFIYNYGHCLNLVLQDSCKGSQCAQALDAIKYNVGYIHDSRNRKPAFDSLQILDKEATHNIRHICDTSWVCRKGVLDVFQENCNEVMVYTIISESLLHSFRY